MVRSGLILILATSPVLVERTFQIMGTEATAVAVADDRAAGLAALEASAAALREAEAMLSTWRPGSELGRINDAPAGVAVTVSPELATLLSTALRAAEESGGAFDPTVGALVRGWDLRGAGHIPNAPELATARARTGPWLVQVDVERHSVTRRDAGVVLEEGAFGKGYALEMARRRVAEARGIRGALLDLGGQVLAWGDPPTGNTWPVVVAHPDRRDQAVATIALPPGWSAATSGASERSILVDGQRFGHILDPRTGAPAPDIGSVTVVAPDALHADILSTALYVLGPRDGFAWLGDRRDVAVLFLARANDGIHVLPSPGMVKLLTWTEEPCLDIDRPPPVSSAPFR